MTKKNLKRRVGKKNKKQVRKKRSTAKSSFGFSSADGTLFVGYVGYPKDNISEELLGTKPLFGELALKHRLSVELIRPLAHGVIRNSNGRNVNKNLVAAQQLVRHLLERTRPKPGQPVCGVIGAPARASIASKRILIDAARGILNAVMIVSEPFAVAYGLGILDRALVIDIGAGTVDLCRLHGTLPQEQDQITLDEAGDFVDEKLSNLIHKKYPKAQFNVNMVRRLKEQYGFVSDHADRVAARFPVEGRPKDFDITDELRTACRVVVPGIVNSIAELIASYDPEFQEAIRSNVILAGGGSQMVGLATLMRQGMQELGGGNITCVEEPVFAGASGALKMAQRMPKHFWQVLA
ncbi:MAG: rod shape-determining protein [Planctomycetota bacterium]